MKKFSDGNCFGQYESDFNRLYFGRSNRYKPFDLDYKTEVLPYINLEAILGIKESLSAMAPGEYTLPTLVSLIPLLAPFFILENDALILHEEYENAYNSAGNADYLFFEMAKSDNPVVSWLCSMWSGRAKNSTKIELNVPNLLLSMQEEVKMMEAGITESEETIQIRQAKVFLVSFFNKVGTSLKFSPSVPKFQYNEIKDFFSLLLSKIYQIYASTIKPNLNLPSNVDIDFIENDESSDAIYKKLKEIMRFYKGMLIIENVDFSTSKDEFFFSRILQKDGTSLVNGMTFKNCHFNSAALSSSGVEGMVKFIDCCMDSQLKFLLSAENLEFDNCSIYSPMIFRGMSIEKIVFNNCKFFKGSELYINYSRKRHDKNYGSITLQDCIFESPIKLSDVKEVDFIMDNVYFLEQIEFDDFKFGPGTSFKNIGFPTNMTLELRETQKKLYKNLVDSGLQDLADSLNLAKSSKNNYDEKAFQAAIASGWLSPEYAAIYLDTTEGYLAKKRRIDKLEVGERAIPFKGITKGVVYPLDALAAYKSNDWSTLAKIRQLMDFPNNVLKEKEEKQSESDEEA